MPSRFPILCLVFLAQDRGTKMVLNIKARCMGMGGLLKQGFIRTPKALQRKSALLAQTLKPAWLEIETSKHFLINL